MACRTGRPAWEASNRSVRQGDR